MILARAQSDRLFRTLTCIKAFAAGRYDIAGPQDVMAIALGNASDELESQLLRMTWDDSEAIGDLLATSPKSLSPAELDDIEAFSDHVNGMVLAVGMDESRRGLFLVENRLVAVVGITQPMGELVPGPYPRPVELALLPFEGVVTYDGFVNEFPMSYGPGLRAAMKKEMDEALSQEPITGAAEFAVFAREVAAMRRDREEKRFAEQLQHDEWEANGNDPLAPGVHRGVLAGLSEGERETRIQQDMESNRKSTKPRFDHAASMRKCAAKGEPHLRLVDSLNDGKKAELEKYAVLSDVANRSKLRKRELADAVAPELVADDELITYDLRYCSEEGLAAFRELAAGDGVIRFSPDAAREHPSRYRELKPWTRLYWTGKEFALAMPDEVRELAAGLDYDAIIASSNTSRHIEHLAEILTELCGVVPLDTFYDRYRELYGTAETNEELLDGLVRLQDDYGDDASFGFWRDHDRPFGDGNRYLIDYRLTDEFVERLTTEDFVESMGSGDVAELFTEASIEALRKELENVLRERDESVRYILRRHAQIAPEGPCPLDPALAERDVLEWKSSLPAAVNLRNWLDAHVPDDDNDLYFADRVIDDLMDLRATASSPNQFLRDASDLGITVLSDDADAIVGRIMAFWNGMPDWESNGWSPDALVSKREGKKMFRNPDGSPMKVGRNDPCPCGSGKKYKNCHGREA